MRQVLQRLVNFSFSLWEHRNEAAHADETSTESMEINSLIAAEFQRGFEGFVGNFRVQRSLVMLRGSRLSVRKAWLKKVATVRKLLAEQAAARATPAWVVPTIGRATWLRLRKPALPTPEMIAQYPDKLQAWTIDETPDSTN